MPSRRPFAHRPHPASCRLTVEWLEARDVPSATTPPPVTLIATGSPAGQPPRVVVTDAEGNPKLDFLAFEASFTGGVRVATADVTGDGQTDVVAVPGLGGAPVVRIFDGTDGHLAKEFMPFEESFRGGLYLNTGDAFGRGYAQILVGAGYTGGPRVVLYDAVQDKVLLNYFAYDPAFRGGVTVSMSDLRGDGTQYIVTGAGKGGGPVVNVFDGRTADGSPTPFQQGAFTAGDGTDRSGIRVGAGGLIDGTHRTILVAPCDPDSAPFDRSYNPLDEGFFVG